jgi:hypothetical protein
MTAMVATTTGRPMSKKKLIIGGASALAILIIALVTLYFVSPYMAFHSLESAARSGDRDRLEGVVDFPALRENLKSEISAAILAKMRDAPEAKSNPFVALGALLAPATTDRMVDSTITPDGISTILNKGTVLKPMAQPTGANTKRDPDITVHIDYRTLNRVRANISRKSQSDFKFALTMERRGLFDWKLIRIDLPAGVLNGDIGNQQDETTTTPVASNNAQVGSYLCNAKAVVDTRSDESPDAVWKAGTTDGDVTQYRVDKKTGKGLFCLHGGYCYPRWQPGQEGKVEALTLTNCNVGAKNYEDDTDTFFAIAFDPLKNSPIDVAAYNRQMSLMKLDLSELEASNVQMFLMKQPNSQCAMVATRALNGNAAAKAELGTSPDYCVWKDN